MQILSKNAVKLIEDAINQSNSFDRYKICEYVCLILEEKYPLERNLEYQLRRMNLSTTREILNAVDIYLREREKKEMKLLQKELFNRLGRY